MKLESERRLPLPRQSVWAALNDPAVLQACIPGCESFDRVEDNTYDAVVQAKVGPVKARFKGRVTLEDLDPPAAYSLNFEGKGGQAGFVKGSAAVRLDEDDGGCRIGYSVKATLGGKLAQLGSRLVDGAAQKTSNEFFENFIQHMGGEGEGEAEDDSGAVGEGAATTGAGPASAGTWAWVAGAALIVLAIAAVVYL